MKKQTLLIIVIILLLAGAVAWRIVFMANEAQELSNSRAEGLAQIEKQYPEFKDFTNQKSFAGQEVKFMAEGQDKYYAFKVFGSGVPVVKATCFRVDQAGQVFKTGEFPGAGSSIPAINDISIKTCVPLK